MKKKIIYKTAPKGISDAIIPSKIIDDFLPAPENQGSASLIRL